MARSKRKLSATTHGTDESQPVQQQRRLTNASAAPPQIPAVAALPKIPAVAAAPAPEAETATLAGAHGSSQSSTPLPVSPPPPATTSSQTPSLAQPTVSSSQSGSLSKDKSASTTKKDGVDEAGANRFGKSFAVYAWRPAPAQIALKFWIIMSVLICGDMRSVIGTRKSGRHRKAADGLQSYIIAFFVLQPMLVHFNVFAVGDTAETLYLFVHHYIVHHLTNAERLHFFGSGSCFFGAVYINAITDRLLRGLSMAVSWIKSIRLIRSRYVSMADTLVGLREASEQPRTVVVEITGGVLKMQAGSSEGDAEIAKTLTFTVEAGAVYVPHESVVTVLFCSNVYETAFKEACPPDLTEKELKADLKITTCANTGSVHIQSDTFFGLRIAISTIAASPTSAPPTQKALRKALRKEGKKLDKERMKRRAAMKSLVYHSAKCEAMQLQA